MENIDQAVIADTPEHELPQHEQQQDATPAEHDTGMTATYSPEDNKLRLYTVTRLDRATYERVKAAGFSWAPKQELFVAPMWTPSRADLLIDLCGEIGDEDTSLVDRAEERADRFSDYSGKRAHEARAAREAISAITENIPFGQPILVGHHSERRARKDAERVENGIRKAVQLWDTASYWKQRAAGALQHAKYKELPGVRARRIKTIEADKRKRERQKQEAEMFLKLWLQCEAEQDAELQKEVALRIAGACWLHLPRKEGDRPDHDGKPTAYDALQNTYPNLYAPRTLEEVLAHAKKAYPRTIAYCDRWIAHYENRIAYERAMLDEQGGLVAEKFDIQPGGRVLVRGSWQVVMKVNKRGGKVNSVRTDCRYVPIRTLDEIKDYQPPTADDAAKVKQATKLPPLVNFPGEGFIEMTAEEYKRKASDYKGTRVAKATDTHGAYRYRTAFLPNGGYRTAQVYLTDSKRIDPPAPVAAEPVQFAPVPVPVAPEAPAPATPAPAPEQDGTDADFKALREQLKAGVKVVSAPQLFPTPAALAERMVDMAEPRDGERFLEPSAGTGRILQALRATGRSLHIVAVEVNHSLARALHTAHQAATDEAPQEVEVIAADFLETQALGQFDGIVMNPPFANADDVKHIEHALTLLNPGGRLVAICANGPRQRARLLPLVEKCGGEWEELPRDTFAEAGTSVSTVLLTLTA